MFDNLAHCDLNFESILFYAANILFSWHVLDKEC